MSCHVMWCNLMCLHFMWCDFLCCVMSRNALRCHVMSSHVMSCHLLWSDAVQWDEILWVCDALWLVAMSRCVVRNGCVGWIGRWSGDPNYTDLLRTTQYYKVLLRYKSSTFHTPTHRKSPQHNGTAMYKKSPQPNRKSPQQVDFPMAQAHRPKSWTNRNHLLKRLCLWGVLQTVAKLKRHPIGTGSPNLMTRYCLRPLKNRSALVFDGKSKWIPKISVLPVLTKSYWQYQSQWQIWETMRSCWHRM